MGDVTLDKNDFTILKRLTGEIRLIPGNHDTDHKIRGYLENGAKKIMGNYENKLHGLIASHIPLHESQIEHRFGKNIHGHVHRHSLKDPRYLNVSCEAINYTPISLEEVLKIFKDRGL